MFTQNDYKILLSILDKDDKKKGIVMTNGTTKLELMQKTGLSITKVTNTLLNFESSGYIEPALKVKNAKSYVVTNKGMKELMSMKGVYENE